MGLFERKPYDRSGAMASASKALARGDRQTAIAEYRKVLELPDIKDSRRLAQEAIDSPFTEEALQ